MEKLNDVRMRILAKRINDKAGKSVCKPDLSSIIDNLEVLLEEKEIDGEVQKYLPLQIKQEVFHLVYPDGYIHCDVEMNFKEGVAMAQAYAFADSKGEMALGEGLADQMIGLVPIFDSREAQVQACRRLAKGRAASDALRDAGIASWLPDDPAFYSTVDGMTQNAIDTNSTVTQEPEAPSTLPFDNDISDPIRSYVLEGGKHPDKNLGDIEKEDPDYLVTMYTAYKNGKWSSAPRDLISNIETIIIQNNEHRFDKAVKELGLTS